MARHSTIPRSGHHMVRCDPTINEPAGKQMAVKPAI
jgi:hypothetical protein